MKRPQPDPYVITVTRNSYDTYVAKWRGWMASCTAGPLLAARAVARKAAGADAVVEDQGDGLYLCLRDIPTKGRS